jgi:hypothetical protein
MKDKIRDAVREAVLAYPNVLQYAIVNCQDNFTTHLFSTAWNAGMEPLMPHDVPNSVINEWLSGQSSCKLQLLCRELCNEIWTELQEKAVE